ncbi:unnamed protein product [Cuscuta europaea]|uniref:Isocitrate lyase n=1 Tax=Cuscuta europaea TaxID=41803 RepID=A0A9P0ZLN4_CUSEU|nr:unnamed protein product [Cuscuta europaea]
MFSAGTSFLASCNCSELISNSKVGPSFSSLFDHSLRRCYRFPTGIGIRISGRLYGEPSGRSKAAKECHVARSSIQAISSVSKSGDSKATRLRNLLESPGIHLGPACFNALSAKLVERAGFDFGFTTGFGISAAQLGLPDTGLITYGEMVAMGQEIARAVSIPLIGDADNGYGNAMNVKRTVKGYIHSGYAGILLEDQVSPKACGHTRGVKVVSREEAVMRIQAAVDARTECGADIVVVARSDSRQAISFEESLWRSRAFADAGADVLFIDALASKEEMRSFCEVSPSVPKMANMLEGGGKTPILTPVELQDIGFKIVAYPLSLLAVSIGAMQGALAAIRSGCLPSPGSMPSFEEMKDILGFNVYYEEEERYALSTSHLSSQRGYSTSDNCDYGSSHNFQDDTEMISQRLQDEVVEVLTPEVSHSYNNGDSTGGSFSRMWSRKLRVKISGRDGFDKLDIRIPAAFLEGITNIVPALVGVNLKELLDNTCFDDGGKQLLDFKDTMGDRIQVFLE